jgi:predicted dehydrogenase
MEDLGVMVVGPGWVAGQHIMSYARNPHTEIRVIAGMLPEDAARAAGYMEQYGLHCEYTDDYEAALKREDIDLVAVCTINHLHYEQGLAAVQAGKHVFVEKPLCFNSQELEALTGAVKEQVVQTQVGHVVRYYPAIVGLRNFLRSGAIGEVCYCECDYWHEIIGEWKVAIETGGSALLMGGCHSVDMVRWMVGEENEVDEVFAYSTRARRRTDFNYDPNVYLLMKYRNGVVAKVGTSLECKMPYVFHLQINGTEGTIRNNGIYSEMFPDLKDFVKLPSSYPDDWEVAHHPFPEEVDDFVGCILEQREPELSFIRAAKTYEVIFAAERSAREGRPVRLPLSQEGPVS